MDYLKGLSLYPQEFGWVQPFEFNEVCQEKLSKWLAESSIIALQSAVKTALFVANGGVTAPTLGAQKIHLERIQALAYALSEAMNGAPSIIRSSLAVVALEHLGGWQARDQLSSQLGKLAKGVSGQLALLPKQSTRPAPNVFIVAKIAEVVAPAGVAVSVAAGSKFLGICTAVFEAAGIHLDPRGAIRAFQNMQSRKRRKTGA